MGVSSVVLYNYIRGFCYSFFGIIIANNYCVHLFVTHFINCTCYSYFYYCIINFLAFFLLLYCNILICEIVLLNTLL